MKYKQKVLQALNSLLKSPLIVNMATVLVITYSIKLLGFFKESYIASEFGLSILIDTYLLAIMIPSLLESVFLSSFSNVFIPNYVKVKRLKVNLESFQTSCVILTLVISGLLLLISVLSYSIFLETIFPGHDEKYYQLITQQFYYLIACIPLWGATSLINGMLNVENEYKYSSFTPIFVPIVTIINIYFFQEELGAIILAFSTFLATALGLIYSLFVATKKKLISLGRPDFKDSYFISMLRQVPYKMSSSMFTSLIPLVDRYFAAKLIVGSIAAINFGQKIPAFVLGFSLVGLGTVLLPHFSKLVDTDIKRAYNELFKILNYLFLFSIVLVGLFVIFSEEIIRFLFERNEFDSNDTAIVTTIQQILLAYVPFYLCGNVMVKFLTSINKNKFMAQMSILNFIINVVLDYYLFKHFGIYGIVLATTIIYSINPVVYYIYTKKQYAIMINKTT
ncbi:murein biosynthesis integral membrane protein MurJ [Zobellia barbeyronii]|uniref:Polysaccharide biosynthesis C-terminal domain-containing protein n=1 Tax=Zobellia barbeyronii TaxID=2748009 RepID=A0ABS5WIG7_9FLAO|nr:lipid II flippase MurJ [Zobellia barbeyronii]MBT2163202.1 polysaccharide biosynthesis C-terminal domain-containing protein [Zobellia barbeyronii]